jgi:propionate CoA-transferase
VFRHVDDGLELIEVAPGVDVQTEVLDVAAFPIAVAPDLRTMDERLFGDEPLGLVPS